jgi:hypothetical protein
MSNPTDEDLGGSRPLKRPPRLLDCDPRAATRYRVQPTGCQAPVESTGQSLSGSADDTGVSAVLDGTNSHIAHVAGMAMMHASPPPQPDVLIRSAVPTFLVADVANTARWYAANLGFQTAGSFPQQEPYAYASLQRGSAEIMLLAQKSSRPQLYFVAIDEVPAPFPLRSGK